MIESTTQAKTLRLIGGVLCLDFANTVEDYRSTHPQDHLTNYADLVAWSAHAAILTPQREQQLAQLAIQRPEDALHTFQRALALRGALHRLFSAWLLNRKPAASDLATLNEILAEALSLGQLRSVGNGYARDWVGEEDDLAQMLYPIARSAADLLTSPDLARLRKCEAENCGWLFVDTSKNHSRRWCSMEDCGNRAKARRHYQLARNK
jgi:predicted RNA-binding Zn ribbon-like protein